MTHTLKDSFLTAKQLSNNLQKSKSTIYRWVKAGQFPKPIKINNSTLWKVSDVNHWITTQGGTNEL